MTSARQIAMVFALSLMLAFFAAEGVSMQEKSSSRNAQDLKVQTSSKTSADWTGNEDSEEDDDDDDDDDEHNNDPNAAEVESEKAAAAAAEADKAAAAAAENAAEAALVQTAKPPSISAAEKAAAEAERAAEVTERQPTNPKKALVQYERQTHHHHKHLEVDQQILIPPQASPAPAQVHAAVGQQAVPLAPSFAPSPALTPTQLAKERALAKKEDELEGKITPHAVEQARLRKNVMMLQQKLHANLQEQSKLKQRIEHLSSEARSDQEIDASAELVANETNSLAMGNMMGRMWKEMRMFDVPMYAEHVAEKLRHLKKDQRKLEAEIRKVEAKLMPAEAPAKKALGEEALAPIAKHVEDALAPKAGAPAAEHVESKTAVLSKMNFWGMSTTDQQRSLGYSLVYLVAGVALAFLFKSLRSSKPQLLTVAEKSGALPNSSDFTFGIFGCFEASNADGMPSPCLLGCFCPCLRWAHTVDTQGLLPYWKAFFAFFVLTALHSYTYGVSSILVVALGVFYRQKLRKKYQIEGGTKSVAMDALVWLCCQPCAIIQEAREENVPRSGGAPDV